MHHASEITPKEDELSMSDASKKILSGAVKPVIDDAFDGFDGPLTIPEEIMFYDMMRSGIVADKINDYPYFVESDYSANVVSRYASFIKKHQEYAKT